MCGRFAITEPPTAHREALRFVEQPNFPPRYNVAPTQPVPIVHEEVGVRRFRLVRWGFLPGWVKDPKTFPLLINARAETLLDKPAFRHAIRRRRCVFLADAFYEWRRDGRRKAPFLVRRIDRKPMPLAGLWETWASPDGEIDTAAIVTTDANGTLAAIHDRMPAILDGANLDGWLDPQTGPGEAVALLRPSPDDWLDLVPVSSRVNKAENDDAGVQEPLAVADAVPPFSRADAPPPNDEDGQGALFRES